MTDEMLTKDFEELLLERLNTLRDLEPDLDLRTGSIGYDFAAVGAVADGGVLMSMQQYRNDAFADTASGQYLDLRVGEVGMTRNPGAKATGTIQVSGLASTEIPAGSTFADSSGTLIFKSTQAVTTDDSGVATLPVEADDYGERYNLPMNTITQALGDFMNVLEPVNAAPTAGGLDREDDAALLARYEDRLTNPPVSGNASQIRQWAMSINGVGGAKIVRLWNGPGTVKVILMTSAHTVPNSELLTTVQNYLNDEERIPIGCTITVVPAIAKQFNITANVQLRPGYTIEQAQQEYRDVMVGYLRSIDMQTTQVQYTRFMYGFMDLKSVFNFSNLLVNGGTQDTEMTDEQICALEEVKFNAI
jgi:uncharacterized phage protein gp47/JayE